MLLWVKKFMVERTKSYILSRVYECYVQKKWRYNIETRLLTGEIVVKSLRSLPHIKNVLVSVCVKNGYMTVSAELPYMVPNERMQAVMEYVARANSGMQLGSFEIRPGVGKVSYKISSYWTVDVLPSVGLIDKYISLCLSMLRYYSLPFVLLLDTKITAREAISLVEV